MVLVKISYRQFQIIEAIIIVLHSLQIKYRFVLNKQRNAILSLPTDGINHRDLRIRCLKQ